MRSGCSGRKGFYSKKQKMEKLDQAFTNEKRARRKKGKKKG